MTLRKQTTNVFHRRLYAGILETVTLLKRDNDQAQGTVTAYLLFNCRRDMMIKHGNPIHGEMTSDHRTAWMIPRTELERVGVNYLNVLDRIVDKENRYWQPENHEQIYIKLFSNYVDIACIRIDPSANFVPGD